MSETDIKHVIASRAAKELRDGQIINLGIGLPTLVADYVPAGLSVVIHSQNGVIGVGPTPDPTCEDPDYANAGGEPITLLPGASVVDSATSFSIIRGGHVDLTFLGAFQVDGDGNVASYEVPGKIVAGPGGAMDLLAGARLVGIVTEHYSKEGEAKLLKRCTFPLTGAGVVDLIITERAVFRRGADRRFMLEEVASGYTLEDIAACTEMDYAVSEQVELDAYGPKPVG